MVPLTRRQTLLAAGAGLAALAGCSESNTGGTSLGPQPPENVSTDPERYSLRSSSVDSLVTAESDGSNAPEVVTDADTAATLSFTDVDGAEAARAFVRETDFDAETLLVNESSVRACYERKLCYVTWSDTEASLVFGRTHRPWDTPCETGASDALLWLVRIPATLADLSGYARGISSGACRYPPPVREAMDGANATDDSGEER